jgi:hypothetical protein
MLLAPAIILHSPISDDSKLEAFVEQCLSERVNLVAIVGDGCAALEDQVDWLVIGDGADPDRFLVTSSHPGETFEKVREFAATWRCDRNGGVQEVRL